jgi:hydroxymethylglutaryl-CoA reductase
MAIDSRLPGFYNLSYQERIQELISQGWIDDADADMLQGAGLSLNLADNMIENTIGLHSLPLGLAVNFVINDRDVLVPMAVEEPSIVAGASYMAKLVRAGGGFIASASQSEMIGQIQVLDTPDLSRARQAILEHKKPLLSAAAKVDPVLERLGGGPRDLEIRIFEDTPIGPFLVIYLIYDVRDAMGANAVNSACESIAPMVEDITGGRVHLRILSNLADRRLARAQCTIPLEVLQFGDFSPETVRDGIIQAWAFAAVDPYRAATHNKGIMNGIDAVVLATGNDWRAVEAGAHAYAARGGRYTSLSTWGVDEHGNLIGSLELPMAVGIIGGATKVHPGARLALKLMRVSTSKQLAEIIVSVGLAQNLAALRALATEGIQRGHMSLHARQVAISAGAEGEVVETLSQKIIQDGQINIEYARQVLNDWQRNKPHDR